MKKTKRGQFAILLTLGTLASCSQGIQPSAKIGYKTLDSNKVLSNQSLSSSDKAEQLALIAEHLVTPTGFMYADEILDQSLALDAGNLRAKFYKAVIATPMALKGIITRIKPLASRDVESLNRYKEAISNLPNSGLKTFLFDGKEDIRDEKGVQAFADEIYNAQDKLRTFLKDNKNNSLTLNMNDWGASSSFQNTVTDCAVEQSDSGTFNMKLCDITKSMQIELNRADMEVLQYMTAGSQIYTAMLTAYDVSGAIDVAEKNRGQSLTKAQAWKKLIKNADFGKLRDTKVLQSIPGIGMDAVVGLRYAISVQDELCPSGQEAPGARKGHLFSKGICFNAGPSENGQSVEDVLKVVDMALSGSLVEVKKNEQETTEVKAIAILENPIQDLKALKPVFNNCDKVTAIADDTLGGTLPNQDANEILVNNAICN